MTIVALRSGPVRASYKKLRTRPSAVLAKLLLTWPAWLVSALLPSVAFVPQRSAHGRPCSGFVYLSWADFRLHDRGHLMPSLLSPSLFADESTRFVGKRLPCSGWSFNTPS